MSAIAEIEISRLQQPIYNLRSSNEQIGDLASSIQQKGLLQPIVARPREDNDFEIVAGNRRYLSCKNLGWKKIPCHIMKLDDKEAFEISLIENVQRNTLSLLEEARSFKAYVSDFGWGGVSDLAYKLAKSVSYVTKRIQLLELPPDVIDAINKSGISPSIAQELCFVKDKDKQSLLANLITKKSLSFRQTRKLLKFSTSNDKDFTFQKSEHELKYLKTYRRLEKSISAIRFAMSTIATIIEDSDDDLKIREILMNHKNMLHEQIDLLIKEKIKIRRKTW